MFGKKSDRKTASVSRKSDQRAPVRSHVDREVVFVVDDQNHRVRVTAARDAEGNASLLELALKKKLPIEHSCGGFGTCGTCRVMIEAGADALESPTEIELEMAHDRKFAEHERLACQTCVVVDALTQDLRVRIPPLPDPLP